MLRVDEHGIAELLLNRGTLNEIGLAMLHDLESVVQQLGETKPSVLIIRSANPKGFSAGADLHALEAGLNDSNLTEEDKATQTRDFIDRVHAVFDAFDMLPCPVIAAVHGVVFGGGFELALTADMIVAEKHTRFAFPEFRLGLIPGFGGIPRLERDLPAPVIRDLLFSGRSMGAERAHELGLVSQVCALGAAGTVSKKLAMHMAKMDPNTHSTGKAFLKKLPLSRLKEEKETFLAMVARAQVRTNLKAFVNDKGPMPYLVNAKENYAN